jgi:alpha-tubulin suppressor-like RCC1 family protein
MIKTSRSIRERWRSMSILIAVAAMLAILIAPALASAVTPQVAAGGSHTVAIKSDGTLWAWGANGNGQLGLGDITHRYSPVQVGSDATWTDVSAGDYHTLAIKSDGTLWAWGHNTNGQLGLGYITQRNTPAFVFDIATPTPEQYAFTAADAVITLQIAVGSRPCDLRWNVSGDGQVTSLDALMILQAAAGNIEIGKCQ